MTLHIPAALLAKLRVTGLFGPGVTEFDAAEAGPVPLAFVAVTVKV
jgi:hypothetical protein